MAFIKPSVSKTVSTLNKLRIYLRSTKKWGKTTLFRNLVLEEYGNPEKGLLVGMGNEIGYTLLDNLNCTHIDNWKDLEELKKWLIKEKGKEHDIQIVAFDVIDELIPIAEKEVCRLSQQSNGKPCDSINKALGGYGAGQSKVKELIKEYFSSLYKAGFGIFAIAHTKTKNIIEKGHEDTEGYMTLTSNLPNTYECVFGDIFDLVLTGMIDREVIDGKTVSTVRKLYFRDNGFVDAGCRFSEESVPEYMVFEGKDTAKDFLNIIKEGLKSSSSEILTEEEFNEKAEEEIKEINQNAENMAKELEQEEKEQNKKTAKELRDIIKNLATTKDKKTKLLAKMKEFGKTKITDLEIEELEAVIGELQ